MSDSEEDHYCSLEGAGLTDRLDNLRTAAEESDRKRLQREAVDAMRALREDFDSGELDMFRMIEKAKRVVDELFDAMGWS